MKILAMADLHGVHAVYRALPGLCREHGVSVVILAGDLLGYPEGYEDHLEAQRADAREVLLDLQSLEIPVLYVMGNDDWVDLEPTEGPIRPVHGLRVEIGPFNCVGYQYSLPFMGGVNEKPEEEIARDLAALEPLMDRQTLLVTHCPAFGILDAGILGLNAGSRSILSAVRRRRVKAHIHGHTHSCFGREGRHFNVAAAGRTRGMVLDLETMQHVFLGWVPDRRGE